MGNWRMFFGVICVATGTALLCATMIHPEGPGVLWVASMTIFVGAHLVGSAPKGGA